MFAFFSVLLSSQATAADVDDVDDVIMTAVLPAMGMVMRCAAEEANGRRLLAAAIDLDEKGSKSRWTEPGAKEKAADAYILAAEVCFRRS